MQARIEAIATDFAIAVAQAVLRSSVAELAELATDERSCRLCGCTELAACEGGCFWVAEDLCSACVVKLPRPAPRAPRPAPRAPRPAPRAPRPAPRARRSIDP